MVKTRILVHAASDAVHVFRLGLKPGEELRLSR